MIVRTLLSRGDEPEVEPVETCTAERNCPLPAVKTVLKPQASSLKPEAVRYCAWHLMMLESPGLFATRDPQGNLYIPPNAGQAPTFRAPNAGQAPAFRAPNAAQAPTFRAHPVCQNCGAELQLYGDSRRCRDCWKKFVANPQRPEPRKCPFCGDPMPVRSNGARCWECHLKQMRRRDGAARRAKRLTNRELIAQRWAELVASS